MHDLTCSTSRLWLQAPDELPALESRRLERHLSQCPPCAAYRHQQVELDGLIRQNLTTRAGGASVHTIVRERLRQQNTGDVVGRRRTPIQLPRWRSLRPALALAPIAALAVALMLFLPQVISHGTQGFTPAGAWPFTRVFIGYPVAIDAAHPDHLLAGDRGVVYQSWNGGALWRPLGALPPGRVVRDVAIDRSNPRRYLVATNHEVLISQDAGRHWTTAARNLLGAYNMFLLQHPQQPDTFFVGPSVLWASHDHGNVWTRQGSGTIFAPNGIQSLAFAPNGDLLTGIWGGGVALSHDGGITWQRRMAGLAPDVMDVIASSPHTLWAATDRGVYTSANLGRGWRRAALPQKFFATGVLASQGYLLAGGNGAVYRSTDSGVHWTLSVDGLPLAPYIYGFVADPQRPQRVYAMLDGDGIYRSDDGGQHWQAASSGLPLSGTDTPTVPVLFRRGGHLWSTTGTGADPGSLSVDDGIVVAAVAPDGASAVYVRRTGNSWLAAVLASGGSSAEIVATGEGPPPHRLFWSPNASQVALATHTSITVATLAAPLHRWPIPANDRLLGWTVDGNHLLVWHPPTGAVLLRDWASGQQTGVRGGNYPTPPLPAPDGRHIATLSNGHLAIRSWNTPASTITTVAARCRLRAWSPDSTHLLLACPRSLQERDPQGRLLTRAPSLPHAFFAPEAPADLLFFRHNALWRWSAATMRIQRLIPNAHSIQPNPPAQP